MFPDISWLHLFPLLHYAWVTNWLKNTVTRRTKAGIIDPEKTFTTRQRHDKHFSTATNDYTTADELLDVAISMRFVPGLYTKNQLEFVHHKSYMNWPGDEHGPSRWKSEISFHLYYLLGSAWNICFNFLPSSSCNKIKTNEFSACRLSPADLFISSLF